MIRNELASYDSGIETDYGPDGVICSRVYNREETDYLTEKRGKEMSEKGMFDMSGKVALITGGGSGLGRAMCEAMAEFGADVVCSDIIAERAEETVKLIGKYGHRAIAVKADVSQENEIGYMVERVVKKFGSLDVVFANAGIIGKVGMKIHEYPVEDWDRVFSVDSRGIFLLMRTVFPIMMGQRRGSFIATGSFFGMWPLASGGVTEVCTAYGAAKATVIMLTKIAAKQYGEYGIRVNCICPGYHRTNLTPPEESAEVEKIFLPLTPLKRVGEANDVKGLAVYLASDASSFVTGQIFVEDGGHMA